MQDGIEILLRKKIQQCEQLELVEMNMKTENQMLKKQISQMESDRTELLKQICELGGVVESGKAASSQTSDMIAILTNAVKSAKEIMTAFLSVIFSYSLIC